MTPTGNHSFDKVALVLTISPDGSIDGIPTWVSDDTSGLQTITPSADGLQCRCVSSGEVSTPITVTVTVAVDDPSTPDLETISEPFQMTWSHSKATALNPGFGEVPL